MRAIILAGGKGTRLYPYTIVLPKPLVPLGDYPILEIIIRQLVTAGFNRITISVNHQAEIIQAFFGDGSKWGIKIDYCREDKPLSTMGPLKLIDDLPENFLVMNGDVLTDLDYTAFFHKHVESKSLFTISAYQRQEQSEFGVLEIDNNSQLCGFLEKPVHTLLVSMGIYMVNNMILDHIPKNEFYGFDTLMKKMLSIKENVNVEKFTGRWLDIGRPDDYAEAINTFEKNKKYYLKG